MKESHKAISRSIIFVLVIIFIGALTWQWNISRINKTYKHEVSDLIQTTIEEQASKGLLYPETVFINVDSSKTGDIKQAISKEIKAVLVKKYTSNSSKDNSSQSFYVLPNKKNDNGNYVLTSTQLEKIDQRIAFLSNKVEEEVTAAKAGMNRNIEELNFWVSLWIGVIGFLGIFIPILLNVNVLDKSEQAEKKAKEVENELSDIEQKTSDVEKELNEVRSKTENAESELVDIGSKTEGIEGSLKNIQDQSDSVEKELDDVREKTKSVEDELGKVQTKTAELEDKVSESDEKAGKALKKSFESNLLYSVNRLSGVKSLLHQFPKDRRLTILADHIDKVNHYLNICIKNEFKDSLRDSLVDLVIVIKNISEYTFVGASATSSCEDCMRQIESALDSNLNSESLQDLIDYLSKLATELRDQKS